MFKNISIKSFFINKLVLFILFFFLVYPNKLIGMPFGTRELTAILGLILFIVDKSFEVEKNKNIFFTKNFFQIYSMLMLLALISLVTIILNGSIEIEYIRYSIVVSTIIFGSYLLYSLLLKVYPILSFRIIAKYIVLVVLLQIIIALLMFIFPSINTFFLNIQVFNELDNEKIGETLDFRLIGFGTRFFGAGVVNAYALILISFLVSFVKSKKELFFYSISFVLIFIIGMMMSRTTIVGFILSVLVLLFSKTNNKSNRFFFLRYIILIVIILTLIIFLIALLVPKVLEILQVAYNFGFEIFINYFENGSAESESTNRMKEMYVWPESLWTYIWGDGRFYATAGDPFGGYYMGVDIGFIRLIYYFGVFGLLAFYWLQFIAVKMIGKFFFYKHNFFVFVMFLYILILGTKGLADLLYLNLIWCVLWINKEKYSLIEKL